MSPDNRPGVCPEIITLPSEVLPIVGQVGLDVESDARDLVEIIARTLARGKVVPFPPKDIPWYKGKLFFLYDGLRDWTTGKVSHYRSYRDIGDLRFQGEGDREFLVCYRLGFLKEGEDLESATSEATALWQIGFFVSCLDERGILDQEIDHQGNPFSLGGVRLLSNRRPASRTLTVPRSRVWKENGAYHVKPDIAVRYILPAQDGHNILRSVLFFPKRSDKPYPTHPIIENELTLDELMALTNCLMFLANDQSWKWKR